MLLFEVAICFLFHFVASTDTLLIIDNQPCRAESLLSAYRYFCDNNGNVICFDGWGHDPQVGLDIMNPCPVPQCKDGCVNGVCTSPGICSCHFGWRGVDCNVCVPLPGCEFGTCDDAMTCNCFENYEGARCDMPMCENCVNGFCVDVNTCFCSDGWRGDACDECIPAPGCVMGQCLGNLTNTCDCFDGFEGDLCDQPVCTPPCHEDNGACQIRTDDSAHICVCQNGYRGETCSQCQPYWNCPNQGADACDKPNDCLCDITTAQTMDPNYFCTIIT